MKLVNKTKNFIISDDVSLAKSFLSRMRGLMFTKKRDLILVSPREDIPSSSIHMLFMLYPLDVIWLNSSSKVIELRRDVRPLNPLKPDTWRMYKPEKKARYVVELGCGELGDTEEGDELAFH